MSAIILLEGCDKVGKTTEAERLASILQANVVHFGVPTENPFEAYRAALIEADNSDQATIIDRLHWSNIAYQTVYRDDPDNPRRMSNEQADELDTLLANIGGVVVLKTRPIDDIAAAMDDEDYGDADPKKIGQLQNIFIGRFSPRPVPGKPLHLLVPFGEVLPLDQIERILEIRSQAI